MDNSRWCVGIALDLARGYVYWSQKGPANGNVGTLRRAHIAMPAGQTSLTRTDIEILYDSFRSRSTSIWIWRRATSIGPIAPTTPSAARRSRSRAGFTAATRSDRQILVKNVPVAIGIALESRPRQGLLHLGDGRALGRANLDGTDNESLIPMAGDLTGIALGQLP